MRLSFQSSTDQLDILVEKDKGTWLISELDNLTPGQHQLMTFAKLKESYESQFDDFELFWYAKSMENLKKHGLLTL